MTRTALDIPEASNLTIKTLRVFDDPPYCREVHIAFTDGTQISIDLEIKTSVKARHYRGDGGDLEIFHQHEEPPTT